MQSHKLQEPQIAHNATLFAKVSPTRYANEPSVLHRRDTLLAGQNQPQTSINRTTATGQGTLGDGHIAVFATVHHSTKTNIATARRQRFRGATGSAPQGRNLQADLTHCSVGAKLGSVAILAEPRCMALPATAEFICIVPNIL